MEMTCLQAQSQTGQPMSPKTVRLPWGVRNPSCITFCTHLHPASSLHAVSLQKVLALFLSGPMFSSSCALTKHAEARVKFEVVHMRHSP